MDNVLLKSILIIVLDLSFFIGLKKIARKRAHRIRKRQMKYIR